jgi:hypothetical protein
MIIIDTALSRPVAPRKEREERKIMKRYGIAHWTAFNQQFLDTCDAVKSWTKIQWSDKAMDRFESDPERNMADLDWVVFEYDSDVEVPVVPNGVLFEGLASAEKAIEYANKWVPSWN